MAFGLRAWVFGVCRAIGHVGFRLDAFRIPQDSSCKQQLLGSSTLVFLIPPRATNENRIHTGALHPKSLRSNTGCSPLSEGMSDSAAKPRLMNTLPVPSPKPG